MASDSQRAFDLRRAAEKQRDRDEDLRAVARGEKSAADVNRENGIGSWLKEQGLKMGRPAKL